MHRRAVTLAVLFGAACTASQTAEIDQYPDRFRATLRAMRPDLDIRQVRCIAGQSIPSCTFDLERPRAKERVTLGVVAEQLSTDRGLNFVLITPAYLGRPDTLEDLSAATLTALTMFEPQSPTAIAAALRELFPSDYRNIRAARARIGSTEVNVYVGRGVVHATLLRRE